MFVVAVSIAVAGLTGAERAFWRRPVREISHAASVSANAASTNTKVALSDDWNENIGASNYF